MLELSAAEAHSRFTVEAIAPPGDSAGRRRQAEVYLGGLRGVMPHVPVSFTALEERARSAMSEQAFAYVAGSAGLESTTAANQRAL